jgi:hypothetical protein
MVASSTCSRSGCSSVAASNRVLRSCRRVMAESSAAISSFACASARCAVFLRSLLRRRSWRFAILSGLADIGSYSVLIKFRDKDAEVPRRTRDNFSYLLEKQTRRAIGPRQSAGPAGGGKRQLKLPIPGHNEARSHYKRRSPRPRCVRTKRRPGVASHTARRPNRKESR